MYCLGHIYKIICKLDDTICYIGSTFDEPRKRWQHHKNNYNSFLNGNHSELSIYKYFDKYGIDNFQLIKIKSYLVYREHKKDFKHLHVWETLWILRTKTAVNEKLPFNPLKKLDQLIRQRKYDNKNKSKKKRYQQKNKQQIKGYQKKYHQKSWYCVCCDKTFKIGSKSAHLKTAKHILKSKCIII